MIVEDVGDWEEHQRLVETLAEHRPCPGRWSVQTLRTGRLREAEERQWRDCRSEATARDHETTER